MKKLFAWLFVMLLCFALIPFNNVSATILNYVPTANGTIQEIPGDYDDVDTESPGNIGWSANPGNPVETWKTDTFDIDDHTIEAGVISSVKVAVWAASRSDSYAGDGDITIYIGGSEYLGGSFALDWNGDGHWELYEKTWNTNPDTSVAWTWTDIDNLEIGISLKMDHWNTAIQCAWIYANVTYTPGLTVATDTPINVEETTVTLSGSTTGADGMTCGFWYNQSSTSGSNFGNNVTVAGTFNNGVTFTEAVTGLTHNTLYYVRAWSLKAGIGFFNASTDEETFTTKEISVTTNTSTSVEETTATLEGYNIGLDGATCGFWYNTTTGLYSEGVNVSSSGTYNDGEEFTKAVTGLTPGAYYHIRAWSLKAGIGFFNASSETYFLTKPYAPFNVSASISENNISLTWDNATIDVTNRTNHVRYKTTGYPSSITDGTLLYNDSSINSTAIYWYSPGVTYYFSIWTYINESGSPAYFKFSSSSNNSNVSATKPDDLMVTDYNDTRIGLTWVKGDDDTVITRKINSYPIHSNDGTTVYNGSLQVYSDTGLTPSTHYYYRAWNWNGTDNSSGYTNVSQWTLPQQPQNVDSETTITGGATMDINISWINGTGSNQTIVVRSYTSQPVNPSDGTEIYNASTANFTVDSGITQPAYYTVFSYNTTTGLWSEGVNVTWYVVWVNCYDESNGTAITPYTVFFTNADNTQTYSEDNASNPHLINVSDIPTGIGIVLQASAADYETRLYEFDITVTGIFFVDIYLPRALPPGGASDPDYDENITYAEDYVIHVVGPNTEYGVDPPIENAKVIIRKYVNSTGDYEDVGIYFSSADGTFTVSLLPGVLYAFNITATDYDSTIESWMPTEIVFSDDRHHTFRLTPSTTPVTEYTSFWDTVTLTGVMNDIDGLNGTITITYSDSNLSTTNTDIYIYEHYNGTSTLIVSINNVSENNIVYTTGIINTTRMHTVLLFFNNTANFDASSPVNIIILPINVWSEFEQFDFEDRATPIFGTLEGFTYAGIISAGLAIMALVMFGPHNTGIGILACGFVLGFTNLFFTALFTGGFNAALAVYIPIIIVIGAMYILVKNPGGHL